MDKLPNRIRVQSVDEKSGKVVEVFQEIVYDNLPLYCNYCKHQGHDKGNCRFISKKTQHNQQLDDTVKVALKDSTTDIEKYQGDAREILNEKRRTLSVDQSKATDLYQPLVDATSEQNCTNTMVIDAGICNNQQATTNKGQSSEVGLNLSCNATKNAEETPKAEVDALCVDLGVDKNSGQHVLQVEKDSTSKNWTLNAHKKSTSGETFSSNSSPISGKGATENFQNSENSNASLALDSKLSPEAPTFVPKSVIAQKNDSPTNAYMTDSGEDFFDEDDENNMLNICFDKVAREGNISPRQQRSGSNKSKKKTHERQHSWDGKVSKEFVPRHLPMRLAKQNHMAISIGSTRSNKFIKK